MLTPQRLHEIESTAAGAPAPLLARWRHQVADALPALHGDAHEHAAALLLKLAHLEALQRTPCANGCDAYLDPGLRLAA